MLNNDCYFAFLFKKVIKHALMKLQGLLASQNGFFDLVGDKGMGILISVGCIIQVWAS